MAPHVQHSLNTAGRYCVCICVVLDLQQLASKIKLIRHVADNNTLHFSVHACMHGASSLFTFQESK